jgi:formate dehydrogenase subunit gamma
MGRNEPWSEERARALVAEHAARQGPLLPVLHAVQETFGHIPAAAIPLGVVTFYHDFREQPAGRHVVKICRAEACQSMGADALVARAETRLGVACGESSADGAVTLEPVYCLGLCACAPSAMVDGRVAGRLDEAKLDALLQGVAE